MATHANIGIRENGKITYIYCHYDGYYSWAGEILKNHYDSPESAKALIALGDISSLGEHLNGMENATIAYSRDKGESYEDTKPRVAESFTDFVKEHDFSYIFNLDEDEFYGAKQNEWGFY